MVIFMKRIISLLLSFAMLFTLLTPALAASNDTSLAAARQERTTVSLSNDSRSRMEIISPLNNDTRTFSSQNTNELNNDGSFLIEEYVNDELTHTVQGSYGGSQIVCIDYENGVMTNQKVINIADRVTVINSESSDRVASASTYGSVLGRIVYNKDIGNTVPGEILTIYSKITKRDYETYNLNGYITDTISDITGILLSFFICFIPVETTLAKIAVAIVGYYGGKTTGGIIDVIFSENVAVDATYYTLTGYHAASDYYSPTECNGVERLVMTKNSSAYNDWIYSGYTPHTWKNGDDLATSLWMAVFARPFPYVYQYR